MNLPFGKVLFDEQNMNEYKDTLEEYKKYLLKFSKKFEDYDKYIKENKHSSAQTNSEISYLKEQSEKTIGLLEDILTTDLDKNPSDIDNLAALLLDINNKVAGLEKNIDDRLRGLFDEMQKQTVFMNKQLQIKMESEMSHISETINRGNIILWVIFIFNILGLSTLVFLVLYTLKLISF